MIDARALSELYRVGTLQCWLENHIFISHVRPRGQNIFGKQNPAPTYSGNLSHFALSLEGYWQMFSQSITVISQLWHLRVRRAPQQLSASQAILFSISQRCDLFLLHMHLYLECTALYTGICCKALEENIQETWDHEGKWTQLKI